MDDHLKMLCPGLKLNKSLEKLNLLGAKATNEGVEHVVEVAKHNYFLKDIKLLWNETDIRLNDPIRLQSDLGLPGTRFVCTWV
jgi:hypothetical protein